MSQKKIHRGKNVILVLILTLLLSSCIEYREEMWLEDDNSGRLYFEIGLPPLTSIEDEDVSELSIVALCDTIDGINVSDHHTYEIDDMTWIHIALEFENILLLNEIENEWFGKIVIVDDDQTRTMKRYITLSDTINVNANQFGKMLKFAMLGQYAWTYKLHFPDKIIETNAHIARTDTLTNTVLWEYNLASLINEQKVMTGQFRKPHGIKGFFQNIFKR